MGTNARAFQHNHTGLIFFKATTFRIHFGVCQSPYLITMSHTVLTNKEIAFQMNN
jgi:hypothetical protein